MKKLIIVALILFPGLMLRGQDNKFTKEINEQVWRTFISSFGKGDEELFKSVHSKDVVRVIQDNGEIFGYDHYLKKYLTV
jgi:hypothetical protein